MGGPLQCEDPSRKLMMLPNDLLHVSDPVFEGYVKKYAESQKLFFDECADAFQKVEELGASGLVPTAVKDHRSPSPPLSSPHTTAARCDTSAASFVGVVPPRPPYEGRAVPHERREFRSRDPPQHDGRAVPLERREFRSSAFPTRWPRVATS